MRLCFDLNGALPACTAGMFSSNFTLCLIAVLAFVLKTFAAMPKYHIHQKTQVMCAFERRLSFVHFSPDSVCLLMPFRMQQENVEYSTLRHVRDWFCCT